MFVHLNNKCDCQCWIQGVAQIVKLKVRGHWSALSLSRRETVQLFNLDLLNIPSRATKIALREKLLNSTLMISICEISDYQVIIIISGHKFKFTLLVLYFLVQYLIKSDILIWFEKFMFFLSISYICAGFRSKCGFTFKVPHPYFFCITNLS